MRGIKQAIAIILAAILALGLPVSAFANEIGKEDVTVVSNSFVKVTVNNHTGRFAIRTVDGQPVRKNDQNVNMMYQGDDPETSFTTFRIDGTDYIFGNPYKFGADFFSEISPPRIVENSDGTKQIETTWSIKGVQITQVLKLYTDTSDIMNAGNVNVGYIVNNPTQADVQVGSRILLDTMVGSNDGPAFQVGAVSDRPLQVERRLVDEDKVDSAYTGLDRTLRTLPAYWVMKDKYDSTNPLATNVTAYGFNNFSENDINIVDEMVVGHWARMANTKWDYEVNENLDFTTDTNDFGSADSAVALYWNPDRIPAGSARTFETVYGLGEIISPDKVFSIRYIDPVNQLAALEDGSGYVDEGVFQITAEIENMESFKMKHSNIVANMQLDNALKFVEMDENGKIVRGSDGKVKTLPGNTQSAVFIKPATPAEAELGIQPKFEPGDIVTATFLVQAKGRPWPTTPEYLLSVTSEEMGQEIKKIENEAIKAQYECSKANFVFLPPVGVAAQTFVYAMTPEEAFASDVKYITLNLSNVEAYNPGNASSDPNFDLYLKETATGNRYKVPVKQSVIMQPANDGQMGDMRITYRTGDLVDATGKVLKADLGPALPLGEYQVEVDYKDTADTGGLYDLTTAQRFVVTENEAARVKKANILAVIKNTVTLNGDFDTKVKPDYMEAFPEEAAPSRDQIQAMKVTLTTALDKMVRVGQLVDPDFGGEYKNEQQKSPTYRLQAFESEKELKDLKDDLDDRKKGEDEVLVEIRGMINQIGSGKDLQYVVDTTSEPAIINKAVAYRGKDMVFAKGQLDVMDINLITGAAQSPFLRTLSVKGDGTLSVANSGFVFHKGEWTLDFYNGFSKTLLEKKDDDDKKDDEPGGEDESLNGSLTWAAGNLVDRVNPLRQLSIEDVYFNRHSLFAAPSFTISGFGMKFNDYILRAGGISFGGTIGFKIVESEIKDVVFNEKGFVGIDASLSFDLNQDIGLIGVTKKKDKKKDDDKGGSGKDSPKKDDDKDIAGEIHIVHYVQPVDGISNSYGIKFKAIINDFGVGVELAFKQVPDKRVLPDVIGFEARLGDPGVAIFAATYLQGIRGAIRELADTIAGEGDVPLTLEAGADINFGVPPAIFYGSIDLTLKKTGFKILGKLDYKPTPASEKIKMITEAKIAAQWVKPWFVAASAELDVLGWNIIIGKASLFVGQNLIKNRIDFEGFVSAKIQIPEDVPVVGGKPLAGVSLGVNNDKMWGSYTILFLTLGITYYFNGGIEFGTSGEKLPEGLAYLRIQDPENGPKLIVLGQGVETLATSWVTKEDTLHEIEYHSVASGVDLLDNGSFGVGIGGIKVAEEGRLHEIPMSSVSGDALLEVEYYGSTVPNLIMKDNNGQDYPLVYDVANINDPLANAFTQELNGQNGAVKKVYIAVPANKAGGTWKLYADQQVDSRLLNIPVVSKLDEVRLTKPDQNPNTFTASWKVANAKPGDTVNLYLTKDAVQPPAAAGEEAAQPGSAGLLVAKDLEVTAGGNMSGTTAMGSVNIDVSQVSLLGATEDIRGMLPQGDYYLRAELKSSNTFGTKTSEQKFTVIDPLAPNEVQDVAVKPAGNGYFNLSFRPAGKKPAQAGFEHSYTIEVMQQDQNGTLSEYDNFSSLLFTEEELAPYWNAQSGKYEGIRLGGWTKASRSSVVDQSNLDSKPVANDDFTYQGLQVGQKYVVGVSAAVRPDAETDKNENLHFANRTDTANTLLPVPAKPVMSIQPSDTVKVAEATTAYADVLSSVTQQRIVLSSDQQNVDVEALFDGKSIAKTTLTNKASGSSGVLDFSNFTTDGTYGIELRSTNKQTGDFSITMLYLTVDTIAPILYLDTPLSGERTTDGKILVVGQTSNDAELRVNGQRLTVGQDGRFSGNISVSGTEPKLDLVFDAVDRAGNRNGTTVKVTNGSYQVPVALVLRKLPNLHVADQKKVEAFLRYSNGVDTDKKPLFREVPVPAADLDKLTYSIYTGEAASVSNTGTVQAVSEGSAIVKAEYQITKDVALQGMTVVDVSTDVSAYTATVDKNPGVTKVNVVAAGEMTDAELVYKVYPAAGVTPAPRYKNDVSGWPLLPADGVVAAAAGNKVAVAKRAVGGKLAAAVSTLMEAKVWSQPAPGGGGGGFMGGGNSDIKANGDTVATELRNDRLVARVDKAGVSTVNPKQVLIEGSNALVNGYEFEIGSGLLAQAAKNGQTLRLALPFADLTIPAHLAAESGKDLKLVLEKNTASEKAELEAIAGSLQAELLGGGEGVTFDIGQSGIYAGRSIAARVAIPDSIAAKDITGVVLRSKNGNWTTVPWALDIDNNKAYVNLTLTDDGSIAFIKNKPSFADVAADSWAKDVIAAASGKLFMLGRGADEFAPDSRITRAEYPTVLLRVLGLMSQQATAGFTDVSADDWFSRSVAIASANGLVNGFEDGTFRPEGELSRLEAMVMAGRALALLGGQTAVDAASVDAILGEFTDGAVIPEWAREAVALCIREGIIDGQDQALLPGGALTRAQAAAIAARLNQKVPVGKL
ncbi:S-layer homology domain-containing protein [Paenibacillus mesotrionivorans]|uniref:S-layer homology domain-containing protein n=1 Tax=Paenibacillus mesotrionivorans TaxID=3160968 RepID=A0ACC7P8J3_9BACL